MGGTFRQKMSFPKKASESNNRTDLGLKFCYLQMYFIYALLICNNKLT